MRWLLNRANFARIIYYNNDKRLELKCFNIY